MKARALFASMLKSFSSGAVYECATKVCFVSSVTAFAELGRNLVINVNSTMDVGKGGKGPLDFEDFTKKACFLGFDREKTNFTTFGPPRKF